MALPALPELRGLRVLLAPPAQFLLFRGLRVLLALLVLLALRVPPDLPGQPVPLELRGLSAQQVLRGRREALGPILIAIHQAVQARVSIGSTATMGRCLSITTTATVLSGLSLAPPVLRGSLGLRGLSARRARQVRLVLLVPPALLGRRARPGLLALQAQSLLSHPLLFS